VKSKFLAKTWQTRARERDGIAAPPISVATHDASFRDRHQMLVTSLILTVVTPLTAEATIAYIAPFAVFTSVTLMRKRLRRGFS
jgi:hypothetical protein